MKILNKLGLYTRQDLDQAFKNGVRSEQGKMYFYSQDVFKFVKPKLVKFPGKKIKKYESK